MPPIAGNFWHDKMFTAGHGAVAKVADAPMRQPRAPVTPKRNVQPTSLKRLENPEQSSQKGQEKAEPSSQKGREKAEPSSQKGPENAEPRSQKGQATDKWCSLCKNVCIMPPITRCKPCNTIYNRVLNAKTMDKGSIGVWDDMEKEKTNDFIMSAQDLKGNALKAKLQTYLSQELESKLTISLIGTGEFKDSPDLQKKSRDKPEQLKNRKESTRTFFVLTESAIFIRT